MKISVIFSFIATAAAAQTLTQKIDVTVVNVDVTVTRRGAPVPGLTRDDFEVLEDGVPQQITNFYALERGAPAKAANAAEASVAGDDERFRRHVLLLIDNTHLDRVERDHALGSLEKFINDRFKEGEYDWSIASVGYGSTHLILPQTSDKNAIHNALGVIRRAAARGYEVKDLKGNVVAITPTDQAEQPGNLMTEIDVQESFFDAIPVQRAIVEAVRAFAGTPGKKIVLLVTGSVGVIDTGYSEIDRDMALNRNTIIREVNAANVNLYILDPYGPEASAGSMYWLARETGGRFMPTNKPEVTMRQFDMASSNFYSLGYHPPHADDGAYHRITVRVKNCRLCSVNYRDGYSTLSRDEEVTRALRTPLSASLQGASLPVTATTGAIVYGRDGTTLPIQARVPFKDLQFVPAEKGWQAQIEIYVSIFDEAGRNLALQRFAATATAPTATASGDLIQDATVKIPAGKPHTMIIAVRDETNDALGVWQQTLGF